MLCICIQKQQSIQSIQSIHSFQSIRVIQTFWSIQCTYLGYLDHQSHYVHPFHYLCQSGITIMNELNIISLYNPPSRWEALRTVRHGRVLKVLGVKRVAGCQNQGAPKCEYVIRPHTPGIHQPAGGSHPSPDWLKKAKAQRKACRSALGCSSGEPPGPN